MRLSVAAAVSAAWLALFLLLAQVPRLCAGAATAAPTLTGTWDARVDYGAVQVPFKFGIAQTAAGVSGWFFNGDEKVVSDSGSFEAGHLLLDFPSYGRRVDAQLDAGGTLSGTYGPAAKDSTLRVYPFSARRAAAAAHGIGTTGVPSIEGLWIVATESEKSGEKSWRFIVHQTGAHVRAAILRVDGDTGALTGDWQDGHFVLSHFDGARPLLIEVTPAADGITVLLRNSNGSNVPLKGYRLAEAKARGIPDPADPTTHTGVRDPHQPFAFSFPDLSGQLVSNTDARFKNKVVVVDIAGSWCPNCHDEAPFLESLYRKYHGRGLEVVTLSFEEPEQYANPTRLRAFVRDFGLDYTVLLAGTLDDLHARLPQAVDLDAYPTTFFIGRDGLVKGVHAGFAAAATGQFNVQVKQEFTSTIEKLLGS